MNSQIELESFLNKGKQESNFVHSLYFVMEKVGGYEQLMELTLPAINEILKSAEFFAKQEQKRMNKIRRKK